MTDWSQGEINDVRNGVKSTANGVKDLNAKQDKALANDKAILDAFNKLGQQIERLTREVKGLREDLNPQLDKKAKLPSPGTSSS